MREREREREICLVDDENLVTADQFQIVTACQQFYVYTVD